MWANLWSSDAHNAISFHFLVVFFLLSLSSTFLLSPLSPVCVCSVGVAAAAAGGGGGGGFFRVVFANSTSKKMKISGIQLKWIERMANNVRCNDDVRHCLHWQRQQQHATAKNRKYTRRMCTTDKYFMANFYEHVKVMSEKQTQASKTSRCG